MTLWFRLIAHLLVTLVRLATPGGVRAVAAESLAIKHQLLIMKRSQRRSPNLTAWDRLILGFCTLLVSPRRLGKIAEAIPCTPRSHAFVERLIGTIRREFLDRTLFWGQEDLERKLEAYRAYYNQHRCHTGLAGLTPAQRSGTPSPPTARLDSYRWRRHCTGLFQTPAAA
jgi:hypothetical protein